MKYVFYIASNFMCLLAALMEIKKEFRKFIEQRRNKNRAMIHNLSLQKNEDTYRRMDNEDRDDARLPVSFDLRVLCFLGALSRMFWSDTPPVAWHRESLPVQMLSIIDVHISPFIWGFMVYVGIQKRHSEVHKRQQKTLPEFFKWPALALASLLIACTCRATLLPVKQGMNTCQYIAETLIVFTNVIEALAMVPQISLVKNVTYDKREAQNFIGLLCCSRFLRFIFWAITLGMTLLSSKITILRLLTHGRLICYMLPDMIHCVLLMGFLATFLRRLARESQKNIEALTADLAEIV